MAPQCISVMLDNKPFYLIKLNIKTQPSFYYHTEMHAIWFYNYLYYIEGLVWLFVFMNMHQSVHVMIWVFFLSIMYSFQASVNHLINF